MADPLYPVPFVLTIGHSTRPIGPSLDILVHHHVTAVRRHGASQAFSRTIVVTSRDGNGQWKGRVLGMSLVGSKGTVKITGDDFRWKFGLRSSWFAF